MRICWIVPGPGPTCHLPTVWEMSWGLGLRPLPGRWALESLDGLSQGPGASAPEDEDPCTQP